MLLLRKVLHRHRRLNLLRVPALEWTVVKCDHVVSDMSWTKAKSMSPKYQRPTMVFHERPQPSLSIQSALLNDRQERIQRTTVGMSSQSDMADAAAQRPPLNGRNTSSPGGTVHHRGAVSGGRRPSEKRHILSVWHFWPSHTPFLLATINKVRSGVLIRC